MRKLQYKRVPKGTSQYGDQIFIKGEIVDAIYIKSPLKSDNGNILLECLPPARTEKKDWISAYNKGIPGYDEDLTKKTVLLVIREIGELRRIRFPLPFSRELEVSFYLVLTESYKARTIVQRAGHTVVVNNTVHQQACEVLHEKNGAVIGLSLIGKSQTGKTSAVRILTSRYPTLIRHTLSDDSTFFQIPYIIAESQVNASIGTVYASIGREIDIICHNTVPYYERLLGVQRDSIAKKAHILATIINDFGIGALFLEEIQNMNFNSTDEKSYESFLTLGNETGVALVAVGTEDARNKMFLVERTAHRVGPEIRSDLYCDNVKFLYEIIKQLSAYQWFDVDFHIDKNTAKAMIMYSCGIIGLLIRIYMYMCLDYVVKYSTSKPTVNEDYVKLIVERHFSGITNLLDEHNARPSEEELKKLAETFEETFANDSATAEGQAAIMYELESMTDKLKNERKLKDYIVDHVLAVEDYDEGHIYQVIDNCFADGAFKGLSDKMCVRTVLKRLRALDTTSDSDYSESTSSDSTENTQTSSTDGKGKDETRTKNNSGSDGQRKSTTRASSKRKGGAKTATAQSVGMEKLRAALDKRTPEHPFE